MAGFDAYRTMLANLCLSNFHKHHHPLHLGCRKDEIHNIGSQDETDNTIVELISTRSQAVRHSILVQIVAVTVPDDRINVKMPNCNGIMTTTGEEVNTLPLTLFCTHSFIDHYDFSLDDNYLVRTATLFPLERVTLTAYTENSFKWASNQTFSTGNLLLVCQGNVLVRQGDPFLARNSEVYESCSNFSTDNFTSLVASETMPYKQGILTVSTEILVIDESKKRKIARKPFADRSIKVSDFILALSDVFKPNQLGPSQQDFVDIPWSFSASTNPSAIFKFGCVHSLKHFARMYNTIEDEIDDVYSTIVLPSEKIVELGLYEGGFVTIKCAQKENQINSGEDPDRIAVVHSNVDLSSDHDENVAYGLMLLKYNVFPAKHLVSEDTEFIIQKYTGCLEDKASMKRGKALLPYADEIHVAVVISGSYDPLSDFSTMLSNFFSTARLMRKDDTFCISTSGNHEFRKSQSSSKLDYTSPVNPVVFFKVTELKHANSSVGTLLVDKSHTTLFQDPAFHGYIPSAMSSVVDPAMQMPLGSREALKTYLTELIWLAKPHVRRSRQNEDISPSILISGPEACGKRLAVSLTAQHFNLHLLEIHCCKLLGETSSASEKKIKAIFHQALGFAPCVLLLKDIHLLAKEKDSMDDDPRVGASFHSLLTHVLAGPKNFPVVVMATTSSPRSLNPELAQGFLHNIEIEPPSQDEREQVVKAMLSETFHAPDISYSHIAQRTAGFVLGDYFSLLRRVQRGMQKRVLDGMTHHLTADIEYDLNLAGPALHVGDFEAAIDDMQALHADAIGAPKIPSVQWDDVGGLAHVKQDILETIQLPLSHPELFASGLRRSGVLLYGPPGTGKTLLAKAVATECSLNFLSVKGPELINMYVGQSEENIREVFERARRASPCVIFFDELDSLAPNRGRSGDSGGVMDRVVSQLLAELDGMTKTCQVFVIGATNRPDLLDPALLRIGRFDKLVYLGVSQESIAKVNILKALTRKFSMHEDCDLDSIAKACPGHMTGADIYALCSKAMMNAMRRAIEQRQAGEAEEKMMVKHQDFLEAARVTEPSVSLKELRKYEDIRDSMSKSM